MWVMHRFPPERKLDRLVDRQTHPADLLDKEFAATRRTLVVRQHIVDSSARERVDKERLPAERHDGIKLVGEFQQAALGGREFQM